MLALAGVALAGAAGGAVMWPSAHEIYVSIAISLLRIVMLPSVNQWETVFSLLRTRV